MMKRGSSCIRTNRAASGALSTGYPSSAVRRRGTQLAHALQTDPAASRIALPTGVPSINLKEIANVNASFDIDDLDARDVSDTSYVSRRRLEIAGFDANAVDEEGLPLVYNEEKIAAFWGQRPGELTARWTRFAGIAVPWLTKLANAFLRGSLQRDQRGIARSAVANLEQLGPTFVKLGQILSIRPDVLPPPIMEELAKLQDNIEPFSTEEARAMVEADLGAPLDEIFSEFSTAPIAAASLAQVYRARLRETGQEVAVKVQRPGALSTISKDLYVMRRGVGVYEAVIKRFTAQTTDYQELLSTFAEGLYTEMDFRNEALNMVRMQQLLDESTFSTAQVVIPKPNLELTTRRVLTMEWVTGVKLTTLPGEELRALAKIGQEVFLTQLLEIGFFHGDPHPGNLLKITEGSDHGKLALLDFGLVAEIPAKDRDVMVSATIHLANKDWDALISDFVALGFLPKNPDRGLIVPVMDRVLSPYLRGGGAKSFNFQALSQDLLAATLEIPFSVPPYMSLLARSVATLEGIALAGDPNYQMVAQAYPFVVRKVLRNESSSSTAILRDILFDADGQIKPTRLSTLLNAAFGFVSEAQGGFVDFDSVPDDGATLTDAVAFLLSEEARKLRPLLISDLTNGCDLFIRDCARKAFVLLSARLHPRLPFIGALPAPPPPPLVVPTNRFMPPQQFVDLFFPPLSDSEEIALDTRLGLVSSVLGTDVRQVEASFRSIQKLLFSPGSHAQEVQQVLANLSGNSADLAVVQETSREVVSNIMDRLSARASVPREALFPATERILQANVEHSGQRATAAVVGVQNVRLGAGAQLRASEGVAVEDETAGVSGNGAARELAAAGSWGGLGTNEVQLQRELQSGSGNGAVSLKVSPDTVAALGNGGEVVGTMEIKRDGSIRMVELKPRRQQ